MTRRRSASVAAPALIGLALLFPVPEAEAAADQYLTISYQAEILDAGTPVDGTRGFKFVIFEDNGDPETVWSNDGTSVDGSQPVDSVDFEVVNGVVSAILGASPMEPISGEMLAPLIRPRLRVWVKQGPWVQLPDQRLTGTPYALNAHAATRSHGSFRAEGQIWSTTGGFRFPDGTVQTSAVTGSGGGGTLDDAYDFGGPGAGATIDADAGPVTILGAGGLNVLWRLGIQTSSPQAPLEILGLDERSILMNGDLEMTNDAGYRGAYLDNAGQLDLGDANDPGAAGTIRLYASGSAAPGIRLDAATQTIHTTAIEPTGGASQGIYTKGDFNLLRTSGFPSVLLDSDNGSIRAYDSSGNVRVHLNGQTGETTTDILHITGGADLAEPFPIEAEAPLEPGTVVVIDPASPGSLAESAGAYDRRVAGVISGAGGVNAGLTLGQTDLLGDGQNVALTGRVYVKADATGHPIAPGDLLTTSDRAGHAMAALDRDRSHGAILGKAMTALDTGTGLVLVLVNLQ